MLTHTVFSHWEPGHPVCLQEPLHGWRRAWRGHFPTSLSGNSLSLISCHCLPSDPCQVQGFPYEMPLLTQVVNAWSTAGGFDVCTMYAYRGLFTFVFIGLRWKSFPGSYLWDHRGKMWKIILGFLCNRCLKCRCLFIFPHTCRPGLAFFHGRVWVCPDKQNQHVVGASPGRSCNFMLHCLLPGNTLDMSSRWNPFQLAAHQRLDRSSEEFLYGRGAVFVSRRAVWYVELQDDLQFVLI